MALEAAMRSVFSGWFEYERGHVRAGGDKDLYIYLWI